MFNALEKDVFGKMLEQAKDEMSNNSCNDAPVRCTAENQADLIAFIGEYTDDDEEREHLLKNAVPGKHVYFQDWRLIAALISKCNF